MRPRDPNEPGRSASTLELFFDLVFVVAVSNASVQLADALTEGHVLNGVAIYLVIFFGIWWAWMNFTWFATSFDTDDWLYRVLTILQAAGVLILAAGVEAAFAEYDFTVVVLGYVVMRVAMVAQWLRASRAEGPTQATARAYALGYGTVQALWVGWLFLPLGPVLKLILFAVLAVAEIAVPIVAERRAGTPWHPHHITERYGLFTLLLMGESLLASTNALIEARSEGEHGAQLLWIAILAIVITAALWWIYFWPPHYIEIEGMHRSFRYGYMHYFIFAAAGALSSGIEVEIGAVTGESKLGPIAASYAVTIPVAVFVLGIWWLAIRDCAPRPVNILIPLAAVLVLLDPILPIPVTLTSIILIFAVVVLVIYQPIDRRTDTPLVES
ncbi:low temperature requirement protein A [Epidermidibacterium keratini]|uniref:Low temperature requirement protein A n=1 Tax=Epidermidibacterium keratini TaxID=1891644 RepID=A0A7L4YTF0_9ACTN|nr:low temperature requirement protein A [Epidermidibacterium keratini]